MTQGTDGYEYELGLRNSMSGPAAAAVRSLDDVAGALRRTSAAEDGLQASSHRMASGISYAVRGFDDLSRGGRYAANGLLDVGKAFTRLGPWLGGAGFVGGTAALTAYAFHVSELKEQTIEAFSVFQGSAAKGEETFRALDTLADSVHAPAAKVQGTARELLELGLTNQTQLLQTVRAVEDLQRVGLEGGAKRLEGVVERSLAAGHFALGRGGAGAARALVGTGVSEKDLAAQLGLSPKQLEAQLKAGTITVEQGLAALDRAIIQGKVGELAQKKFTVEDAFTNLHNAIRGVFQETDTGPLTQALRTITEDFVDSKAGADALREVVQDVVDLFELGVKGADSLGKSLGEAADFAKGVWQAAGDTIAAIAAAPLDPDKQEQVLAQRRIKRLGRELGDTMADQQETLEKAKELAKSGASAREIEAYGRRHGVELHALPPGTAVPHTREPEGIRREVPGLEIRPEAGDFSAHIPPAMKKAGEDAGKGIEEGFRDHLEIQSPSRVMYELGEQSGQGLEDGVAASLPSGKRVEVHVDVGGINLPVAFDPTDMMPLLESSIADVFERIGLELGR